MSNERLVYPVVDDDDDDDHITLPYAALDVR